MSAPAAMTVFDGVTDLWEAVSAAATKMEPTRARSSNGTDRCGGRLGNGMNNDVLALTVFPNQLIAGGSFSMAGDFTSPKLARWAPAATGNNHPRRPIKARAKAKRLEF